MFEALRGLRDAVAPSSSSTQASDNNNNNDNHGVASNSSEPPDTDELWQAYKAGDTEVVRLVTMNGPLKITSRDEFIRWHAKMEMDKDTELVMKLASAVLAKSADIDRQVQALPGMQRTRTQQMEYMEQLIAANQVAARELQETYDSGKQKRDACRQFIKDRTGEALGIEEEREV
jgi:hypothetical protein